MSLNPKLQTLTQLLVTNNLIVTTAESCTGGMLASALTDLSGSSQWFELGFITYSNQAKKAILDVPADLLSQHGAISQETVIAMAKGALAKSQANIAVSISGIAGPSGATKKYSVGSVWFAIVSHHLVSTHFNCFLGNRDNVRKEATQYAIQKLITFIQNNNLSP